MNLNNAPLDLTNISFFFLKLLLLVIFNLKWHVRAYAANAKA